MARQLDQMQRGYMALGCPRCGFFGTQGCPRGDADCPMGRYIPPKTPEQLLEEEVNKLLPVKNFRVHIKKTENSTMCRVSMSIINERMHDIGAMPADTEPVVIMRMVEAYRAGLERGKEDGKQQFQKEFRDFIGAAKDMGD